MKTPMYCVSSSGVPPTEPPASPCQPNPCGPNSECRLSLDKEKAVCSCLQGFFGSPCRPECTIDSDCPLSHACLNLKCVDPCPGACGINTECNVIAHTPICRCQDGLTGNPYSRCYEKSKYAVAFPFASHLTNICTFSFIV